MAVSDDYNRADGGMGANWTTASSGPPTIVSNQIVGSGAYGSAYWSANAFNATQSAQLTYKGTNYSGPAVRISSGGNFYFYHSAGELQKIVGGSVTTIGTSGAITSGQTFKVDANGTTLRTYINGVENSGPITDASLSTGSAGVACYGAGTADDFLATGEIVGGGGGTGQPFERRHQHTPHAGRAHGKHAGRIFGRLRAVWPMPKHLRKAA